MSKSYSISSDIYNRPEIFSKAEEQRENEEKGLAVPNPGQHIVTISAIVERNPLPKGSSLPRIEV